ncbi:MAG: DUF2189 domain-containing protein [Acetobacteraceae bacterium]|nr:DUF2189 domain-containing protein [Acetobacteraceae bacterium]
MTAETAPATAAPQSIRQVPVDRPWAWLAAGWRDLLASPGVSLAYGAAFALMGWVLALLLFGLGLRWAVLPATAGFFLVAPILAAGLYETSRRRALGQSTTLAEALSAFNRNRWQFALMGAALLLIHLFWVRVAGLLFAVFFGLDFSPTLEQLPWAMLRSPNLLPFLIVGTGIGFFLAVVAFAISAVSIPMLVERDVSAVEAIVASIRAVAANPRPMALWAALIVVFVGLGLVPFFLGLAVALPLIAHATWHAYKDLVG